MGAANRPRQWKMPRAATGSWYDAKAVDPLTDKTREQLSESLAELSAIVAELPEDKPVVMAGFSQGACLSIEYAMAFGSWSGALVAFTGCRVGLASDERHKTDVTGLPVYLTGSDADPWIPVGAFAQSVLELATLRARLRADVFPLRGHEVSDAEIAVFQHTLQSYSQGPGMPW
jgi:predicted esterase